MSLSFDVDGDGNKDALYVTENGTLAAKRIDSSSKLAMSLFGSMCRLGLFSNLRCYP